MIGIRYDLPGSDGTGTPELPAGELERLTFDLGGGTNAYTTEDVTVYHSVVPAQGLETLLWAEAERMARLEVSSTAFETERRVVTSEHRERVLNHTLEKLAGTYNLHDYDDEKQVALETLERKILGILNARENNVIPITAGKKVA